MGEGLVISHAIITVQDVVVCSHRYLATNPSPPFSASTFPHVIPTRTVPSFCFKSYQIHSSTAARVFKNKFKKKTNKNRCHF